MIYNLSASKGQKINFNTLTIYKTYDFINNNSDLFEYRSHNIAVDASVDLGRLQSTLPDLVVLPSSETGCWETGERCRYLANVPSGLGPVRPSDRVIEGLNVRER